jgi:uncharacterized protein (TIGR03435 family)
MFMAVAPTPGQARQSAEGLNAKPAPETAKLEFEVASVRPADLYSDSQSMAIQESYRAPRSELFSANTYFNHYIEFAYHLPVTETQDESLVKSLDAAGLRRVKWAIKARAEGIPTQEQLRQMVRSLLEDRFKLRVHFETRNGPIYALMLDSPGRLGPQLHRHLKDAPCGDGGGETAQKPSQENGPPCGGLAGGRDQKLMLRMTFAAVPISQLIDIMPDHAIEGGLSDIPIVDQTGLQGIYDIQLQFAPSPPASRPDMTVPGQGSPTLTEALKKQLGLRLVKTTGPVKFLVIDHVEQPSPN